MLRWLVRELLPQHQVYGGVVLTSAVPDEKQSRTHLDDHSSRQEETERDRGGEIKKRGAEKHFHCSAQWSKLTLGCRQENLAFFIDCRVIRSPPISSNKKI